MSNKKILMVLASEGFRDEELFVPAEILENAGFGIEIASDKKGTAEGDDGGQLKVDYELGEVACGQYEAVVFIGGPGALEHLDTDQAYKLAQDIFSQGKIVAAICIAPVILAKAGLLKEKKATVWTSSLDKTGKKEIEKQGATFQKAKVVKDGRIITANGPQAAKEFGQKIATSLQS